MRPGRCLPKKWQATPGLFLSFSSANLANAAYLTGLPRAPLPSRSDTTSPQDRGDKDANSGDARERSDGRLYPLPRSSCRAEAHPAGRGFCARDGLLDICAAFPSSGTKNRAPRSPSKPSRANAFQRMANLRAEKFHSMTQTPEVKQRPRRTRSQHSSSLAWWASSQARNSCRLDAMFTLAGMAVPAPTSTTCISALRRSASRTKL